MENVTTPAAEVIVETGDVIVETAGEVATEAATGVMQTLREHAPAIALGAVIVVTGYTACRWAYPRVRNFFSKKVEVEAHVTVTPTTTQDDKTDNVTASVPATEKAE